jgi:hypothetical protein
MGRVAVADEPAMLDGGLHGRVDDIVVQAKALGNFMHTDPILGLAARHAHDVVADGNRRPLRNLRPSLPDIRGLRTARVRDWSHRSPWRDPLGSPCAACTLGTWLGALPHPPHEFVAHDRIDNCTLRSIVAKDQARNGDDDQ